MFNGYWLTVIVDECSDIVGHLLTDATLLHIFLRISRAFPIDEKVVQRRIGDKGDVLLLAQLFLPDAEVIVT